MNAFEIPGLRFSLPAGGTIARHRFVDVNSSGNGVAATAAGKAVGVSMNQVETGQVLEVADGIVIVEASAVIAAGAKVCAAADGKAAAVAASEVVLGIALTASSGAGQLVSVKLA